jgi:4-amino-4-deoxy-L-arabinose transferase-like glycosyltransferase
MASIGSRVATRWEALAIAGVLLLAVTHRWERIGDRNLWPDEAYSLELAQGTIPQILTFLRGNDAHPAGYYVMLSSWIRVFGEDLATMRVLSALFGIGALVLVWRLGRRLFGPAVGVGAAALLALSPFQIFASNELRMYMPLEFLALVSTWLLWRVHESAQTPRPGYAWAIAYGASLAAMAYVSYYAFLVIPAHLLWLVLQRTPARHVGAALATAVVLYAPWVPYVATLATFLRDNPLLWRAQPLWPTYVPELVAAQTFGGYLFNMLSYHSTQGMELKYYGIFLFLFAVLAAAGARALGRLNRPGRALVALSWAVPIGLVVLASLAVRNVAAYHYHLSFLQPFLALVVAAGIVYLREEVARAPGALVSLVAAAGVLLVMAPAVDNLQWNFDYQYYRYDRAARLVRNTYRPDDVVIYLPNGVRRGFHFYFDPPGRELGVSLVPRQWSKEALQRAIQDVADALGPADRRVWLVYSPPIPPGALESLLEAVERRGYRRVIVHDYKGIRVGLLVRPVR